MDTLGILFGNEAKVKLLRLFLFNETIPFDFDDISERADIKIKDLKKELSFLLKMGCIKKRPFSKEFTARKKGKELKITKKVAGWMYDQSFLYGESLRHLFSLATISTHDDMAKRMATVGRVKFLVVAGVFIQNTESRVDLLIVGDGLNLKRLENLVKMIEAEIGREINYSSFETQDFMYRLGLYDKLIRDILDFPHKTLINKLGIE